MAAALSFCACSSSEDSVTEEKPAAQTVTKIHVTVGAGIDPTPSPSPTGAGSSDAATRSTVDVTTDDETNKKTRTLKFTAPVGVKDDADYSPGDRLYIVRKLTDGNSLAGELTMTGAPTADGTEATFEGELKVYNSEGGEATHSFGAGEDPLEDSEATLIHAAMSEEAGDYSFNFARRTLTFADATRVAASAEALMTKGLVVSGPYNGSGFALTKAPDQPILNCTIAGLTPEASYTMTYRASIDGAEYDAISTGTITADAQGTATFACIATEAMNDGGGEHKSIYHAIRLTNTANGEDTYTVNIGQKEFASKVYNLSRRFVDLSVKYGGCTAVNGDILYGYLSGQILYIAARASVTLQGVFVDGGIVCRGNATIILDTSEGGNVVTDRGITIGSGTLTIQGSGDLTVTDGLGIRGGENSHVVIKGGNISICGIDDEGAGIGSGFNGKFGSITIEGGTVTVEGGDRGAGIGSGNEGGCGNITITGGTVTATGGEDAAGIGSGSNSASCGNIIITSGVTSVTATKGDNEAGDSAPYSIGNGYNSTCGTVTIGCTLDGSGNPVGGTTGKVSDSPYTYKPGN